MTDTSDATEERSDPTNGKGSDDESATSGDTGSDQSDNRSYSQEELNRIIEERLRRERAKYADYGKLKQSAQKLAELEQSNMSELEKERAQREAAMKRAEDAEAKARNALMRAAVVGEASAQGAVDVDAVWRLIETDALTFEDDGTINGAADAVASLLASKPYLKGTRFNGSADGGARGNGQPTFTREQLRDPTFYRANEQAIMQAMAEGRIKD